MHDSYPLVLAPAVGATFVPPASSRKGKTKKKGPSELIAFSRLHRLGLKSLRADVTVKISGHNYEPDRAYVDERRSIGIGIEVDEPYSVSGHPSHYIDADGQDKDGRRNELFQQAGWWVARFSEEMLYKHPEQCMRVISEVMAQAGAIDQMPEAAVGIQKPEPQPRWTEQESWRLKNSKYRKTYLGFDPTMRNAHDYLCCMELALPVLRHSFKDRKVLDELCLQLKRFLFH